VIAPPPGRIGTHQLRGASGNTFRFTESVNELITVTELIEVLVSVALKG
jgi:hypothetical protein